MGHEARFASFCFTPLNNCHFSSWRETKYAFCVILFHAIEQLPFFITAWNKIRILRILFHAMMKNGICSMVSDAKLCNNVANYGTKNINGPILRIFFDYPLLFFIFSCFVILVHVFSIPQYFSVSRPFLSLVLQWVFAFVRSFPHDDAVPPLVFVQSHCNLISFKFNWNSFFQNITEEVYFLLPKPFFFPDPFLNSWCFECWMKTAESWDWLKNGLSI